MTHRNCGEDRDVEKGDRSRSEQPLYPTPTTVLIQQKISNNLEFGYQMANMVKVVFEVFISRLSINTDKRMK